MRNSSQAMRQEFELVQLEKTMSANTETVLQSLKPEAITRKKVACLSCGLPTPVATHPPGEYGSLGLSLISIVRCKVCGKEAPYRLCDMFEYEEMRSSVDC
jgi:hypothetical protein